MSDGSRKAASKSTFHFVAGLGSGVLSAVLLQPFDLLKTRVQQRAGGANSLRAAIADIRSSPSIIPALWRGALPSALRTGFGSAIYFTSLNAIRQGTARHVPWLSTPNQTTTLTPVSGSGSTPSTTTSSSSSLPKLSKTGNLLSGAIARSFAGFLLMPLTVLKVRYESTLYQYTSLSSAARDIHRREGVRGFFSGVGATTVRDAPYAGLYVLFYEEGKKILTKVVRDSPPAVVETGSGVERAMMSSRRAATINFASGLFSATLCSVISNPFDAVKTRIQLQPRKYRNMVSGAVLMVREDGFRSLFDGLALRMSRKALSSALAWTVYEELIRRAEVMWARGHDEEGEKHRLR